MKVQKCKNQKFKLYLGWFRPLVFNRCAARALEECRDKSIDS